MDGVDRMNTSLALGLILGMFTGGTIVAVFMGTVAHNHWNKYRATKMQLFMVEEELIHCQEGKAERVWQMRSDGMDAVVYRGRPDLDAVRERASSRLSDQRSVVWDDPNGPPQVIPLADLDDLPEWEGEEDDRQTD